MEMAAHHPVVVRSPRPREARALRRFGSAGAYCDSSRGRVLLSDMHSAATLIHERGMLWVMTSFEFASPSRLAECSKYIFRP